MEATIKDLAIVLFKVLRSEVLRKTVGPEFDMTDNDTKLMMALSSYLASKGVIFTKIDPGE